MIRSNPIHLRIVFVLLLAIAFSVNLLSFPNPGNSIASFHLKQRVNAHGDEFMAVRMTSDGSRLIIGTEKGEILVWNISLGRITQRLKQQGPVHALVLINNDREVIAAGGEHAGDIQSSIVWKWNLENGTHEKWNEKGEDAFLLMATDAEKNLVAASSIKGRIVVWEASSGKIVASWKLPYTVASLAVINRKLYITPMDEKMLLRASSNAIQIMDIDKPDLPVKDLVPGVKNCLWMNLNASPDGKTLAATSVDITNGKSFIRLIDLFSGAIGKSYEGTYACWFTPDSMLLFDTNQPLRSVHIQSEAVEIWKAKGVFHAQGNPDRMLGAVATPDGKIAFGIFQLNAGLVRWDAQSEKGNILSMTPGNIYAMDVFDNNRNPPLIITGGDDGFVRIWKSETLELYREFKAGAGVPQSVTFLVNGLKALFSFSGPKAPTSIVLADLNNNEQKQLLSVDESNVRVRKAGDNFVYNTGNRLILSDQSGTKVREFALDSAIRWFEISDSSQWMAATDKDGSLYVFELSSGRLVCRRKLELTRFTISSDGRHVYFTEFAGGLKCWDTKKDEIKPLSSIRGQASSLSLSEDEKHIVVGGNHRDVQIYNAASGNIVGSWNLEAADFSITNARLQKKRLLLTTDIGVLIDAIVKF
jgi:WD40 repeat protein